MNRIIRNTGLAVLFVVTLGAASCENPADTASHNLSEAAENFEIHRRIVFYNSRTDTYMLSVEGRCSIEDQGNQLEVVCKDGDEQYRKHFLGLNEGVAYFAEQLAAANVSEFHYRVTFKPQAIIPEVDFKSDVGAIIRNEVDTK